MKDLSSIARSAYTDLVRLLRDDAAAGGEGTPTLKQVNGKGYWYLTRRIGTKVVQSYVGEDNDEIRARISKIDELRLTAGERRQERSRLVRLLRAEGMTSSDRPTGALLSALSSAGAFRLGGTVVGTNAFRLYEGELGLRLPLGGVANTGDVDIAQFEKLSFALEDKVQPSLAEVFSSLKFAPLPAVEPGKTWRWSQGGSGQLIEFLTPAFGEESLRTLPALGVNAQALNYLNYLIADPIHAAALYRSGILVQIPRPERYAIHKLIVADRRIDGARRIKTRKDQEQAAFLIEALATDRPDELAEAYQKAVRTGPRWREHIWNSLKHMKKTQDLIASVLPEGDDSKERN